MKERIRLTIAAGTPVVDNQSMQTAGPHDPMLSQGVWFLEKPARFNREVIPRRRMHAKGSAAHGTFTVTHDITPYTQARILPQVGKKTNVFLRFSIVAGEHGAVGAERDIRGFSMRFYTEWSNWDLVGNDTPAFYLHDPFKSPDPNYVVRRDPRTDLCNVAFKWNFLPRLPESLHQLIIDFGDRSSPENYRHIHGLDSHTFSFINTSNEYLWTKFHFKTQQSIENLTNAEAAEVIAQDRESSQYDLCESIGKGDFPHWEMYMRTMPEKEAAAYRYNPFDLTKIRPHDDYPLTEVGFFELSHSPDNHLAEIKRAAFTSANVVPGIGFSPDGMLQGRLFSCGDAYCCRLGVNHHRIPVNTMCYLHQAYHRSGGIRVDGSSARRCVTCGPDSFDRWQEQPDFSGPSLSLESATGHWNHRVDNSYYSQSIVLFHLFTDKQKQRLFADIAKNIHDVSEQTQHRQVGLFSKVDPVYDKGVADALGLKLS